MVGLATIFRKGVAKMAGIARGGQINGNFQLWDLNPDHGQSSILQGHPTTNTLLFEIKVLVIRQSIMIVGIPLSIRNSAVRKIPKVTEFWRGSYPNDFWSRNVLRVVYFEVNIVVTLWSTMIVAIGTIESSKKSKSRKKRNWTFLGEDHTQSWILNWPLTLQLLCFDMHILASTVMTISVTGAVESWKSPRKVNRNLTSMAVNHGLTPHLSVLLTAQTFLFNICTITTPWSTRSITIVLRIKEWRRSPSTTCRTVTIPLQIEDLGLSAVVRIRSRTFILLMSTKFLQRPGA
jgi:hypothetical protein